MSDIDRSIASGKLCHVHWHVTRRIYSVKESGHPVYYVPELTMRDVVFHVDDRLRAMFEARTSRRTVHALVKGRIISPVAETFEGRHIRCNPFAFRGFRYDDNQEAHKAERLALHRDRSMIAITVST
jgi:hypothetical protein